MAGGIDYIFVSRGHWSVVPGSHHVGPTHPGDHPSFKVELLLTDSVAANGGGSSTPTSGDHYRKVAGVGAWGGICRCPSGQEYSVGDNKDACGSLACEGGVAGDCVREVLPERDGMKVTCAASGAASGDVAPGSKCAPFSDWPDVDGVTCEGCTALVLTDYYEGRCDLYCESFGHVCAAAAEEVNEDCQVLQAHKCSERIVGTSDMLCTCHRPEH